MKLFRLLFSVFLAVTLWRGEARAQADLPLVEDGVRLPAEAKDGVQTLVADLDLDGYLDLIHLEAQRIQTWMQERSTGRFLVRATLVPTAGAITILRGAVGRLVGADLFPDLMIALSTGNLLLLRGDGQGGLVIATGLLPSLTPTVPTGILVGNLDKQNGDDLLLLFDSQRCLVLASTSTGAFVVASAASPLPQLPTPTGALADLNGDGYPELVLASGSAGPALLIFSNAGSYSGNPIQIGTATLPPIARVAFGELNGDGKQDLVLGPLGGTAAVAPLVFLGTGLAAAPFVAGPAGPFACLGFRELVLADLARRGIMDLIVTTPEGQVLVAPNQGAGTFAQPANALLDTAPRGSLLVLDFDRDQDVDLFVDGAGTEAVYLIGGGPGRWMATERDGFPLGVSARSAPLAALVDCNGDSDPDLVVIEPLGQTSEFYKNSGDGRFQGAVSGILPPLPSGSIYSDLRPVALRTTGSVRDLVALGTPSAGNPSGARILVAQSGGGFLDETAQRWPSGVVGSAALAIGPFRYGLGTVQSDLVVADASGRVTHLRPDLLTGKLTIVPSTVVSVPNLALLLMGFVNGDFYADLVTIDSSGKVLVWLGTATGSFGPSQVAIPSQHLSKRGLLADLDGDGLGDLLLVTPSANIGLTFLRGVAGGTFVDASATWIPSRAPTGIVGLELLGKDVVLAANGSPLQAMRVGTGAFAAPVALPSRGSTKYTDLLVADVDLDGDLDVVGIRSGAHPCLLYGAVTGLTQLGMCQGGRNLALRFRGPPGGIGFLFYAPTTTRLPFAPYGILRLTTLTQLLSVPLPGGGTATPGRVDLAFPIAPIGGELTLPMQAAFCDPSLLSIVLGNLENVRIVDF